TVAPTSTNSTPSSPVWSGGAVTTGTTLFTVTVSASVCSPPSSSATVTCTRYCPSSAKTWLAATVPLTPPGAPGGPLGVSLTTPASPVVSPQSTVAVCTSSEPASLKVAGASA